MTVAEIAMTVADEIRDHQERCQPFLLRLRMIVRGEAEAALSRPVAAEVGQSMNAIIAEAEAAGRAALAAVGDSHRGAAAGTAWLTAAWPIAAWAAAALTGPPPGPRRRAPHRGLAIAAAVVAVAAAMVASVAVISAVHSTKTTPVTSPLAALVDPGLVDVTATLGYQQAISAGTGMVLTPSSRVMTNNDVIEGAHPSRHRRGQPPHLPGDGGRLRPGPGRPGSHGNRGLRRRSGRLSHQQFRHIRQSGAGPYLTPELPRGPMARNNLTVAGRTAPRQGPTTRARRGQCPYCPAHCDATVVA
jgi:hypothetical protein